MDAELLVRVDAVVDAHRDAELLVKVDVAVRVLQAVLVDVLPHVEVLVPQTAVQIVK